MKKWFLSLKLMVLAMALTLAPGCGQTGDGVPQIPGVTGPSFNIVDGKVLITIKLLQVNITAGGSMIIPKTKDSRFEISPNIVDGGTLLQFTLDPADIKGVTVAQDPNTLPDGRPIPGIPGGALPSLRIDTPLFHSSYYFSQTLFGIYLPFNFDTRGLAATYQFSINGKVTGSIGIVSSDANGKNSGLLIFLQKAALKDAQLTNMLEESLRNPGVVY
jgi:hypothetical protein